MDNLYDEVEIEDMTFDDSKQKYTYQCPCGDYFQITLKDLAEGKTIATCPTCSLKIKVIFDEDDLK